MALLRQIFLLALLCLVHNGLAKLLMTAQDLTILENRQTSIKLYFSEPVTGNFKIVLWAQHPDLIKTVPTYIEKELKNQTAEWTVNLLALSAGKSVLTANVTPSNITDISEAFVRVTVEKSEFLYHISAIVGWLYFFAWSVSFYPQIYSNYKRKSVVGLNFDYLSLNIVGFMLYSIFNCGLYYIPEIEQEYFNRHPKGLNPVQPNDVFFSLHAVFATAITIVQCFMYDVGNQRVSTTARVIHGVFSIFVFGSLLQAVFHALAWLDFLYYCSYVKLSITLIKYVPQAFYNYKRKSTVGWSIGNIFLDFAGGVLSMLQMILNAHNYNDWLGIFGDPTKFGLGFFSVAFDLFFIVQHYIFYRDRLDYSTIPGRCNVQKEEDASDSVEAEA